MANRSNGQAAALRCLTTLLDGSHRATPDQLAGVLAEAGAALGWDLSAYLITFDQQQLVPLAPDKGEPLGLDDKAGRAFRTMQVVPEGDTAWAPLLNGAERLGVLRAVPSFGGAPPVDDADELRWISMLLGHLVTSMTPYGDLFTRSRGGTDRTLDAELVWSLVPPLTYASQDFVISGLLEPSERVAGDAFDYAVEGSTVNFAIFDGTGHDLGAGLLAAVALAAYRNHRRREDDLATCAAAIDQALIQHSDAGGYVTGVLARLDTVTGVLECVLAGHPSPLVLRAGQVVQTLDGPNRGMFGLGDRETAVGRAQLEYGDKVLLYTDGITEARDADGGFFGLDRLTTLLERHDAQETPSPETLRLVIRDVLTHQRGVLQDDATLMLLEWAPGAGLQLLPG